VSELARPVVVVSPHLDDAVLSCGALIAQLDRPVVLTVFAGSPASWTEHREWDHDWCGFEHGVDVVAARIREDDAALAILGAVGVRLAFLDEQYREPGASMSEADLGASIAASVEEVGGESILMPLGLGHIDHRLTSAGCRDAARRRPDLHWFAYQDLPYGYEPELFGADVVRDALAVLSPMAPAEVQLGSGGGVEAKDDALNRYPSQMRGLGARRAVALGPERFWRLAAERK
jgi:LmbE family N-acetylglucosaminyl deacetylase